MQTLEQYIAANRAGRTQAEIAAEFGIAPCYLSQILNRRREPGRKAQLAIFRATGGAVTPDSWLVRATQLPEVEEEFIEP